MGKDCEREEVWEKGGLRRAEGWGEERLVGGGSEGTLGGGQEGSGTGVGVQVWAVHVSVCACTGQLGSGQAWQVSKRTLVPGMRVRLPPVMQVPYHCSACQCQQRAVRAHMSVRLALSWRPGRWQEGAQAGGARVSICLGGSGS